MLDAGLDDAGSPPRVRGKQVRLRCPAPRPRLTPACAGKTLRGPSWPAALRAHPRVCGENSSKLVGMDVATGSPPRVRGKPVQATGPRRPRGLTPACAGKTPRFRAVRSKGTAHPRVCGENVVMSIEARREVGSPPRVRGKPPLARLGGLAGRLTPACAGKTAGTPTTCTRATAHPRVCGENAQVYNDILPNSGSPPRVRGKPRRPRRYRIDWGLTPACAGKTPRAPRSPVTTSAHPRVCGENTGVFSVYQYAAGSPPRVRGKPGVGLLGVPADRLTPACAGKTPRSPLSPRTGWAHPRVCGENAVSAV